MEQHLAHFRAILNSMRAVAEADAEGHYNVEVAALEEDQAPFHRLFCCSSSSTRSFRTRKGARD